MSDQPVRPGPAHRIGSSGRPSALNDPEFAKAVAQAFVDGNSRRTMCTMFGLKDPDTITTWRRDPRVKVHAFRLMEDRVLEVTRKVDAKIANILQNEDLSVKDLLAIRKEFLGGALRVQTENADDSTIGEAQDWLENSPDAVEKLNALFAKQE